MAVYEAKTVEDLSKVVDFIASQPYDSIPRMCMNPLLRELTPEYAAKVLSSQADIIPPDVSPYRPKDLGFHVFWAEDEKGKVRAAIFIRFKDIPNPLGKYAKVAKAAYCCVDSVDYERGDGTFFQELCLGMIKNYGKARLGEFVVTGKFLDWVKNIFGEEATVLDSRTLPNYTTGEPMTTYLVRITWEKFL